MSQPCLDLFDHPPPAETDFAPCEGCGQRQPVAGFRLYDYNHKKPKQFPGYALCAQCQTQPSYAGLIQ